MHELQWNIGRSQGANILGGGPGPSNNSPATYLSQ